MQSDKHFIIIFWRVIYNADLILCFFICHLAAAGEDSCKFQAYTDGLDYFPNITENSLQSLFTRSTIFKRSRFRRSSEVVYLYSTPFNSSLEQCENISVAVQACFISNVEEVIAISEFLLFDREDYLEVLNFTNGTIQIERPCTQRRNICCQSFAISDHSWIHNSTVKFGIRIGGPEVRVITFAANDSEFDVEGCTIDNATEIPHIDLIAANVQILPLL